MALISEFLYQYLLDWLCPAMEAEYKRLYDNPELTDKINEI